MVAANAATEAVFRLCSMLSPQLIQFEKQAFTIFYMIRKIATLAKRRQRRSFACDDK
jgi:hypothetical protein